MIYYNYIKYYWTCILRSRVSCSLTCCIFQNKYVYVYTVHRTHNAIHLLYSKTLTMTMTIWLSVGCYGRKCFKKTCTAQHGTLNIIVYIVLYLAYRSILMDMYLLIYEIPAYITFSNVFKWIELNICFFLCYVIRVDMHFILIWCYCCKRLSGCLAAIA